MSMEESGSLILQFFSVVGVYWEDGLGKVFGFLSGCLAIFGGKIYFLRSALL